MTNRPGKSEPPRRYGKESGHNVSLREAAILLFAEHGFAGTRIRMIVKAAAPISPACIYLHFGDKAGLYRAIADDLTAELQALIANPTSPAANANRMDSVEQARQMLTRLAAYLLDPAFRVKARFLAQDALSGLYGSDEASGWALLNIGADLVERIHGDGEVLSPECQAEIAALPGQIVALVALNRLAVCVQAHHVSPNRTVELVTRSVSVLIEQALSRLRADLTAAGHAQAKDSSGVAKQVSGTWMPDGTCGTKQPAGLRSITQGKD